MAQPLSRKQLRDNKKNMFFAATQHSKKPLDTDRDGTIGVAIKVFSSCSDPAGRSFVATPSKNTECSMFNTRKYPSMGRMLSEPSHAAGGFNSALQLQLPQDGRILIYGRKDVAIRVPDYVGAALPV
jgi:hypothetical protein